MIPSAQHVRPAALLVRAALAAGVLVLLSSVWAGLLAVLCMVIRRQPARFIVPALLKLPYAFSRASYLPLVLLHASLVIRVGGDLAGLVAVRRWGGMLNAIAILLFLLLTVASVLRGRLQVATGQQSGGGAML